jgi:hypothetical protein
VPSGKVPSSPLTWQFVIVTFWSRARMAKQMNSWDRCRRQTRELTVQFEMRTFYGIDVNAVAVDVDLQGYQSSGYRHRSPGSRSARREKDSKISAGLHYDKV